MKNLYFLILIFIITNIFGSCNPGEEPEKQEGSAYITDVYDYVYAPGQHAQLVKKQDADNFIGIPDQDLLLGGFGGYIIAGFDHNVPNVEGEYDFEVFSAGISPEPAIVYVMSDENEDGLPNDTWYELKGNLFGHEHTIQNYKLTYFKAETPNENIKWEDNLGNSGELKVGYANESVQSRPSAYWWWSETDKDEISFVGTRLPDAYINESTEAGKENWVVSNDLYVWGYAENNYGEDYAYYDELKRGANRFDISNAVDAGGNPVSLKHIRFIKIQTGVFQQAGWLNEVSSEIQGARDLHFKQ